MKNKLFSVILFVFIGICNNVEAQLQGSKWFFGHNAGLQFTSTTAQSYSNTQIIMDGGGSSVCDAAGNLLLYCDGNTVYNKINSVMQNGTGLLGSKSCTTASLIVKKPGSYNLYYVFTNTSNSGPGDLYYSIVDVSANNNYGSVISKNNLLHSGTSEKLTAILHQNQYDIWLVGHENSNFNFYSYLITDSVISQFPIYSVSHAATAINASDSKGQMKASPCGDRITASYYSSNYAEVYNFDKATGIVSGAIKIGPFTSFGAVIYGAEFSNDGSKVYYSGNTSGYIAQADLNAGSTSAIQSSLTYVLIGGSGIYGLQLAPNGKIYAIENASSSMWVITNPNVVGPMTQSLFNVLSPGYCTYGIPNFPSYYFCSTWSSLSEFPAPTKIDIYPNPASSSINIDVTSIVDGSYSLSIRNVLNESVNESTFNSTFDQSINIRNLVPGIYLLQLKGKAGNYFTRFIKE